MTGLAVQAHDRPSGDEIGTERVDDHHLAQHAHPEIMPHVDDPIDLRCFAMRSTDTGRVDEHFDGVTDERVAPAGRDLVLQLRQLGEALGDELCRDLLVETGGVRPVLAAVGEEATPVQLGVLHEPQESVVVALRLTGVADDEVAAERGVGLAGPDVGDPAQEAIAVSPAPHPAQQRLADVLQREVEVRHPAVADGVDQPVAQIARVEVQQADTIGALAHGAHQRDDRPGAELVGQVLAVRSEVLGNEHDLAGRQLVDLAQDRLDGAAALRAAERRDRAEPALPVAALGDLDVRPRRRRRRTGEVEEIQRRGLDRLHGDQPASWRRGHRGQQPLPEPRDAIDLGQRRRQLGAIALGHAAGDHEPGAVATALGEGEHRVDRLLAGRLDERTRVDDDEIGGPGVVGGDHPVGQQRANELVRIDLVLRTAQRLDVEALGHAAARYRRPSSGKSMTTAGTS